MISFSQFVIREGAGQLGYDRDPLAEDPQAVLKELVVYYGPVKGLQKYKSFGIKDKIPWGISFHLEDRSKVKEVSFAKFPEDAFRNVCFRLFNRDRRSTLIFVKDKVLGRDYEWFIP